MESRGTPETQDRGGASRNIKEHTLSATRARNIVGLQIALIITCRDVAGCGAGLAGTLRLHLRQRRRQADHGRDLERSLDSDITAASLPYPIIRLCASLHHLSDREWGFYLILDFSNNHKCDTGHELKGCHMVRPFETHAQVKNHYGSLRFTATQLVDRWLLLC